VQPMGPGKPPPNDQKHLLEILEARMNHENGVAA
jgi:hypothetical protein